MSHHSATKVKVFVGEAGSSSAAEFRERFEAFGNVVEVVPLNNRGKKHVYVIMDGMKAAKAAVEGLNGGEALPGAENPPKLNVVNESVREEHNKAAAAGYDPLPAKAPAPQATTPRSSGPSLSTQKQYNGFLVDVDDDIPAITTTHERAGTKMVIRNYAPANEFDLRRLVQSHIPTADPYDVFLVQDKKTVFFRVSLRAEAEQLIADMDGKDLGSGAAQVALANKRDDDQPYKVYVTGIKGAPMEKVRGMFEKYGEVLSFFSIRSKGNESGDLIVEMGAKSDARAIMAELSRKYSLTGGSQNVRIEPCKEMVEKDPNDPLVLQYLSGKREHEGHQGSSSYAGHSDRDYNPPHSHSHSHSASPSPNVNTTRIRERGPPGSNVYAANFPTQWTNEDLRIYFQEYGRIISTKVFEDQVTGASRGFGFISFDNARSANEAVQGMNGKPVAGKVLKVSIKD